jgi:plastocyanin
MARWRWVGWGVLVGALCASSCNGGGTQAPGPPADLMPRGGAGQSWYFNNPLPTPLSVTVFDVSGGPVPGVVVTWAVTSGSGSGAVNPAQSTTDANGIASTSDSVGSGTIQQVSASVSGLPSPANFTEFATRPDTSGAVTVGNNFFNPDSSAVQVGSMVKWTWNPGGVAHTITFVSGPSPLPAEVQHSTGSDSVTFAKVGTYGYHCRFHSGMNGTVVVVH